MSAINLRTRNARRALKHRPQPYFVNLGNDGLALGYRKGARGGTWIARRFLEGTKYAFKPLGTADDHADADHVAILDYDDADKQARSWTGIETGPYTVTQAMDDYITWRERVKRKKLDRTRTVIAAHILPTLGRVDLSNLKRAKLEAWRDGIADAAPRVRSKVGKPQAFRTIDPSDEPAVRARQATANRVLTTLKAALNYALDRDKVSSNAAWKPVKPYRNVDVPKIRFLSPAEASALVNACAQDFRPIVQAAILTGCRYGELKAMTASAFDSQNSSLFIAKSKNGEARHVLLNAEGATFFHAHTHGKSESELIFVKTNGTPWGDSEQKRPMDAACETAKLKQVTFHILRHTYASQLAMNAVPMKLIADQLGHKSTRITERHYAHLGDAYKRETIQRSLPSFGFVSAP